MDTLHTLPSNSESLSRFPESSFFVVSSSKSPWEAQTYSFCTTSQSHKGQFGQNPKYTEVGSHGLVETENRRDSHVAFIMVSRRRQSLKAPGEDTCRSRGTKQFPV